MLAAADSADLASMSDEELLRSATYEARAVVTENVRDFDPIIHRWAATGEHHSGVIFTSPRRYHRGSARYPANLVAALRCVINSAPAAEQDWVIWLQ